MMDPDDLSTIPEALLNAANAVADAIHGTAE
jgi:hypothetical protein